MISIRKFSKLIEEIALENNIKVNKFSDDWIIELNKDGVSKFIVGYKFDNNSSSTSEICNDKYALFSILENSAIPVIKYDLLFNNNELKLKEFFKTNKQDIVIKPNEGTCGNDVYHVKSEKEALEIYKQLIKSGYVCICPFYNIQNEYRAICLDGNIEYSYKKVKPIVIGNGKDSLQNLLLQFNESFFSNKSNFEDNEYDLNYVPSLGEKIEYEWRFNLSKGAKIQNISKLEQDKIEKLAKKAASKVNLNFGSIDIIETLEGELKIIEINSGVMMENLIKLKDEGYKIAKEIYKKAIIKMFE